MPFLTPPPGSTQTADAGPPNAASSATANSNAIDAVFWLIT
jgi:hypothetical protein